MKICFADEFWDTFHQLPPDIQKSAKRAFERLALNSRYPGLHCKCVNPAEKKYSIRIGRTYRALGYMEGRQLTWYWIWHHKVYERLI